MEFGSLHVVPLLFQMSRKCHGFASKLLPCKEINLVSLRASQVLPLLRPNHMTAGLNRHFLDTTWPGSRLAGWYEWSSVIPTPALFLSPRLTYVNMGRAVSNTCTRAVDTQSESSGWVFSQPLAGHSVCWPSDPVACAPTASPARLLTLLFAPKQLWSSVKWLWLVAFVRSLSLHFPLSRCKKCFTSETKEQSSQFPVLHKGQGSLQQLL